ncbi:GNAT family N-acetyltransferase [Pseudomonas aeruginosa]|uniref:GNAT family N-acetyltransferase n=1 Tax=Pseudomonas aeruginosa TaxID=287 RepID=UPI001374A7E4|nr:GNAT family N-acetyltransferase [Pseudomonas aeruginosa]
MDLTTGDLDVALIRDFRHDARRRAQFNALTERTYGFDFEQWYRDGFWSDSYQPHALLHDDRLVANVSVNLMSFEVDGAARRYVQIGTVMTEPEYRQRGLGRLLLERVLADWRERCDMLYLFANDTVLDFYPRFGFRRVIEHEPSAPVEATPGDFIAVDMDDPARRRHFLDALEQAVPISPLALRKAPGHVMFSCTSFLRDNVFHSTRHDAYAVAEHDGADLLLLDVFAPRPLDPRFLAAELARPETRRLRLGFTPFDTHGFTLRPVGNDDALFVLGQAEPWLDRRRLMFPLLSHA